MHIFPRQKQLAGATLSVLSRLEKCLFIVPMFSAAIRAIGHQ
jgi:hypothetical protein